MTESFETVYSSDDNFQLRLEARQVVSAQGQTYRHHRLVVANGRVGAVVIATHEDQVLLVRSERLAAGEDLWELPRGIGDPADDTAADPGIATALRELREETGLTGSGAVRVSTFVIDSTLFPQPVAAVACGIDTDAARREPDGEVSEARWVPIAEVADLVQRGTIRDAISLAAIAAWWSQAG